MEGPFRFSNVKRPAGRRARLLASAAQPVYSALELGAPRISSWAPVILASLVSRLCQ